SGSILSVGSRGTSNPLGRESRPVLAGSATLGRRATPSSPGVSAGVSGGHGEGLLGHGPYGRGCRRDPVIVRPRRRGLSARPASMTKPCQATLARRRPAPRRLSVAVDQRRHPRREPTAKHSPHSEDSCRGRTVTVVDQLIIRGAREHNLKDISLELPRDALIVFTGLSGSGKSSLAFDTIFAEGQRRYVESLSAYARQFLGQMDKPDVDFIEGLSPAVSIDQKSTSRNPRSTVGTITEVYDYLRLLWARIGHPHCPECGRPIARQTPQQIVDRVL